MRQKQAVATVEEEVIERSEAASGQRQPPRRQPRYNVILWNDDDHSYDYVIQMVQELFGFPSEKAFGVAKEVDTSGRCVCLTTTMEHAELKRDQIHAFGRDQIIARCTGSMSASIEPIE